MAWLLRRWCQAGPENRIPLGMGARTAQLPFPQALPGLTIRWSPPSKRDGRVVSALLREPGLSGLKPQPGRGQHPTSPFHHQNSTSTKASSKNECEHSPEGNTGGPSSQDHTDGCNDRRSSQSFLQQHGLTPGKSLRSEGLSVLNENRALRDQSLMCLALRPAGSIRTTGSKYRGQGPRFS